ncbi:MAG: AAA family ATPase [Thermodesulfobacteriota bacterium]
MNSGLVFDPDYDVEEVLWTQPGSVLVRARSQKRRRALLLKAARGEPPPPVLQAWERELSILRGINGAGPESPLGLEVWKKRPILVLPDLGARPLSCHAPLAFSSPERFLSVACELGDILRRLHRQGMIHQFLTPENVLVNRESGKVELIGLVFASSFYRKARGAFDLRMREGGLCCVAPEQTGLLNRLMDGRTDIYALGCLFYQMLSGQPVIDSEDPEEIIAFHLSGRAPALTEINRAVPVPLTGIVEKCLQKEPDERYQTIAGLSADLALCLDSLRRTGEIEAITPGRQDVSPFLRPPGRMVGRRPERDALVRALCSVASGARNTVFVAGPPGVGKTALVAEIAPAAAGKKMIMLSGKFDPVVNNRPYAAICQAISSWALSVQWEGPDRVESWSRRLRGAMGGLGRVITDLAPEAAPLLGDPPPLPEFPPREAQGRFLLALSRFFSILASGEGLVLFLDDLQWADPATLAFLSPAATGAVAGRFLLVGAFRDTEYPQDRFLRDILSQHTLPGETLSLISLSPLGLPETKLLINELCGEAAPKEEALFSQVFSRTSGNPFYVRELLQSFLKNGSLRFDEDQRRFCFEEEKAASKTEVPDQRAILREQILSLPDRCRETICAASAVGNSFSPEAVARIMGKESAQVEKDLAEAARREFIRPVSGLNGGSWMAFSHDHVREEAYAQLPPDAAAAMHLSLSRMEVHGMDPDGAVFFAADHANRARDLIASREERMEAAQKNLAAGRLAREAAAFLPAWRYLSSAVSFLPRDAWQTHYDTALAVYTAAAEAAYLASDFEVATGLSAAIAREARRGMDRARALHVAFLAQVAKNRLSEALETGLSALSALGFNVSGSPGPAHILYYYLKVRRSLPKRKWKNLLSMKETATPEQALAISLFADMGVAAFGTRPLLTTACILHEMAILSRAGLCPEAGSAMAAYGFFLDQVGRAEDGYRAGLLAEELQNRWPGHPSEAATLCILNSLIRPWKEPLRESLSGLARAYESGLRAGNFEWGTMAAWVWCYQLFYAGFPLAQVDREIRKVRDQFAAMGLEKEVFYLDLDHFCAARLTGCKPGEMTRGKQAYYDPEAEARLLAAGDQIALYIFFVNKLQIEYWFGEFEKAAESGRRLDRYLQGAIGTQALPVATMFDCLAVLAGPEPEKNAKRVEGKMGQLAKWARRCPANNRSKLLLVRSEMARVAGKDREAERLYRQAAEEAQKNSFIHEEALALELFGKFRLLSGDIAEGKNLLARARAAYGLWGAAAKVEDMDRKLGMLFLRAGESILPPAGKNGEPGMAKLSDLSARLSELKSLLAKASPEERARIFLERLGRLCGASAGALFLVHGEDLAPLETWGGENARQTPVQARGAHELAMFTARKALCSGDWVKIADMRTHELPGSIRGETQPEARSVLAGPLAMDGRKCILYLENRFLADAFDPVRINLVKAASGLA